MFQAQKKQNKNILNTINDDEKMKAKKLWSKQNFAMKAKVKLKKINMGKQE